MTTWPTTPETRTGRVTRKPASSNDDAFAKMMAASSEAPEPEDKYWMYRIPDDWEDWEIPW